MSEKVYEMLWDCRYCSATTPAKPARAFPSMPLRSALRSLGEVVMLRKSEEFRRAAQRHAKKKPKARKPKRPTADTSLPGVSATAKKRGMGHTESRNESRHADRKASFALEDSATGKPSRKSTRKSSNRSKSDSNLRQRQTRRTTSAKTRARRGK